MAIPPRVSVRGLVSIVFLSISSELGVAFVLSRAPMPLRLRFRMDVTRENKEVILSP